MNKLEYTPRYKICVVPGESSLLTSSLRRLCLADYGQTWRHSQNRKYITYRNATREELSQGHRQQVRKWLWWSLDSGSGNLRADSDTRHIHGYLPSRRTLLLPFGRFSFFIPLRIKGWVGLATNTEALVRFYHPSSSGVSVTRRSRRAASLERSRWGSAKWLRRKYSMTKITPTKFPEYARGSVSQQTFASGCQLVWALVRRHCVAF